MASTADTLTANGAPVTLAQPAGYSPTSFAALQGADALVVAYHGSSSDQVVGYDLSGAQTSSNSFAAYQTPASVAAIAGGGFVVTWGTSNGPFSGEPTIWTEQFGNSGENSSGSSFFGGAVDPTVFTTPEGFHLEWNTLGLDQSYRYTAVDVSHDSVGSRTFGSSGYVPQALLPYANVQVGGADLVIVDNQAHLTGAAAVTVPGEPSHAMTEVSAAALADGHTAAVAWADSGTGYVSIFDAATDSFGAQLFLDWGGAKDLHTVALADGGFAVSWQNGGACKGELFTADGTGGGVLSLTGQFGALDSHGDLYTVGLNSDGPYVVQTYAVGSGGSSGGGTGGTGGGSSGSVSTSDPDYTAPDGVTTITLTGSNQTVHANNGGDVINSDNTVNHLYGGTGNDTFHLGRGGDVVTGGGGADTFAYAENPWNGGAITDFSADDRIDLSGMLSSFGYSGSDPIGAGYLKIVNDSNGNAQVWSDTDGTGSGSGWWLVATVEGVSANQLHLADGVITLSSPQSSSVSTSDPDYTAPDGVTAITLTGSNQTIHANNGGDVINSDNTVNHLYGGTGADTFHLGRGGDIAAGGGGADTFAYAENPWNGGHITDFSSDDRIDLSGMLSTFGYSGSDPIGAGYLKIVNDSHGAAQVWSDTDGPGSGSGWWLVATVDGVSANRLQIANGVITETSQNSSVSTAAASYTAPNYVNAITLTGSQQTVHANDAQDTTIWSDNTGNTIYGGTGDDVIHVGRGGDTVTGGAGKDVFVFDENPWAGATIKDFDPTAGDSIDVSGLLAKAGYTGSDPIADGYLKQTADSHGNLQIWSDMHQPGDDGWWLVATVNGYTTPLHLTDDVFHLFATSGTRTFAPSSSGGQVDYGFDTGILTGSNQDVAANNGGNTLIDNGSNNQLAGAQGNDTLVFGPSTTIADGWGGADTFVINAHPTVQTRSSFSDWIAAGSRIDVHNLLNGIGYTGADPVADGHVWIQVPAPDPNSPPSHAPRQSVLMWDPDGSAGPAAAMGVYNFLGVGAHYQDGFFVFG